MSNASLIGWTIFLWLVYFRLMRVKLVTEIRPGELRVRLRGLFRSVRIPLDKVNSAAAVTFDPVRDWGGYGFRHTKKGTAYLAGGGEGVELQMTSGGMVLIGSRRASELTELEILFAQWRTHLCRVGTPGADYVSACSSVLCWLVIAAIVASQFAKHNGGQDGDSAQNETARNGCRESFRRRWNESGRE